jgi:hypothetical protein
MATSDPQPVAATLPYHFDTGGVVTLIVRGIAGLEGILVFGALYSLGVSRNMVAAAALLVIAAGVFVFGRLVLKNLEGTRGMITREAVAVQPGGLFGLRLAGPAGTYPLRNFAAVRVDRILPSDSMQSRGHERVILVGKSGAPDILVARTDLDAGRALGRSLAAALNLPFDERYAPH